MSTLGQPNAAYLGDHGDPDPGVRAAILAADTDRDAYLVAVAALCGARLLLPIVASGDESMDGPNPDRHAEMAAVLTRSASGATAVMAFTGLDALKALDPAARPVPCTLDEVAATALETGSTAVLIDLHGPRLLIIEEPLLGELARQRRLVRTEDGWGWLSAAPRDPDSPEPGPAS